MAEEFESDWGDYGIHMGPFGFGFFGPRRFFRYSRTEQSHILRVRINPDAGKEQIKVRLVKPGVLEIEWPRRAEGEEIPVE
jgi:hypothetical protein